MGTLEGSGDRLPQANVKFVFGSEMPRKLSKVRWLFNYRNVLRMFVSRPCCSQHYMQIWATAGIKINVWNKVFLKRCIDSDFQSKVQCPLNSKFRLNVTIMVCRPDTHAAFIHDTDFFATMFFFLLLLFLISLCCCKSGFEWCCLALFSIELNLCFPPDKELPDAHFHNLLLRLF